MPTQALHVQGNGRWQGWSSIVGAVLGYDAVNDSSDTTHDSDATYLVVEDFVVAPGLGRVSFPLFYQAEGLVPSSILVRCGARKQDIGNAQVLSIGFAKGDAVAFHATLFTPGVDYSTTFRSFATNPLTAMPWQPEDLIGLEACISGQEGAIGISRLTLVSGEFTYVPTTAHLPIEIQGQVAA